MINTLFSFLYKDRKTSLILSLLFLIIKQLIALKIIENLNYLKLLSFFLKVIDFQASIYQPEKKNNQIMKQQC